VRYDALQLTQVNSAGAVGGVCFLEHKCLHMDSRWQEVSSTRLDAPLRNLQQLSGASLLIPEASVLPI